MTIAYRRWAVSIQGNILENHEMVQRVEKRTSTCKNGLFGDVFLTLYLKHPFDPLTCCLNCFKNLVHCTVLKELIRCCLTEL